MCNLSLRSTGRMALSLYGSDKVRWLSLAGCQDVSCEKLCIVGSSEL